LNRRSLANRAITLAGGTQGFSINYDPDGLGDLVTEKRWRQKDANGHYYSACQDLASRLALEACDLKQGMVWCNRVDGGNKWIPGENLIRIKRHAPYAWKGYFNGSKWDIRIGDAVEVQNQYGPHTYVVTEITYDANGKPATCDHADYGQSHAAGPSCRVYMGQQISCDATGLWRINNNRILGRLDMMALREQETGLSEDQSSPVASPAPVPDTRVTDDAVRTLRFCVRGDDVKDWQAVLNRDGADLKVDGIYGQKTKKATMAWQAARGLTADGEVGPKTRKAAGI
jgi:hypothetical protein